MVREKGGGGGGGGKRHMDEGGKPNAVNRQWGVTADADQIEFISILCVFTSV